MRRTQEALRPGGQQVLDPDGRRWAVTVHRWRSPRWRPVAHEPLADPEEDTLGWSVGLLLVPIAAVFARGVVPSVRLVLDGLLAATRTLAGWRWVVARAEDGEEVAWRTLRPHVAGVAEQVARQVALGHGPAPYNTIRE